MSTTIDSRVVAMKFDGAQFKRSASEALGLLARLKAQMNDSALGKGLSAGAGMAKSFLSMINPINIARKAFGGLQGDVGKFNMGGAEQQVSGLSKSFIAMSTVAITALANITNRAVNAGLSWAKSFTVGPILDGLHEYETNLKSIQTIQANTDKPLPVINKALQDLNMYSDQTIYNFSEMARNIGTFTAAGVGLKDSVSSIKGIANMAALSGSSSEQAATAMYQLSQAIASGKVGLMDWNSVVNAGMGGKKLQTALAQTAVAMGELDKSQVQTVGSMKKLQINGTSFRESIMSKPGDKPWFTSEVLVNTLAALDGRFSKAALSQETLADGTLKYNSAAEITAQMEKSRQALAKKGVKLTDEQFAAMMKLSDAAFKSATEVKTLGQVFDIARETLGSGWAATFQNIFGDLGEAKTLFTGMSNAINDFIKRDSLARNNMLAGWKKMGGRDALIDGLKNAFVALSNVIKPIGQAFRDIFPRQTSQGLFDLTVRFRDFMKSLQIGEGSMDALRRTFGGFFAVISIGLNIISNVIRYFVTLGELLLGLAGNGGGLLAITAAIGDVLVGFQEWLVQGGKLDAFFTKIIEGRAAAFGPIIKAIRDIVTWMVKLASNTVGDIFGWVGDHADDIDGLAQSFGDLTQSGIDKLTAWFKPIAADARVLGAAFKDLAATKIGQAFEWLKTLKPYITDARELAEAFLKIVGSGITKFMDSAAGGMSKLGPLLSGALDKVKASMSGLGGDSASKAEGGINRVKEAMGGSQGIAEKLQGAWDKVVDAFRRLGEVLGPVGDTISEAFGNLKGLISKGIDSLTFEDVVKAINVGIFAALLLIFRKFGKSFGSVMDGVKGVLGSGSGVLDQLKGNLKSMQNEVRADMILKIAAAVGILAVSLLILSTIPGKKLATSLGAVAVTLIMLTKTMAILNKQADGMNAIDAGKMVLLSAALVGLGVGMAAMAVAIAILGNMDTSTIVKGLVTIAGVLAVVTAAAAIMGTQGGLGILLASVAITILAAALTAFAGALKLYSMLDTGMMVEGGLKIAGMLLGLGLAMTFMSGSLAGAAALFIIAAALTAMIPSLVFFMNMDGDQLKTMLISLGAFFALLAVAGLTAPLIAALGTALITLGVAVLAIGAGLALVGVGMTLFAAGLAVFAASGTAAFAVLSGVITLFLSMFPFWMAQLGVALAALAKVIREQGPPMVAAMGTVLRAVLNEITKSAPAMGRAFRALVIQGLTNMRILFPRVVATGIAMVMALLNGIDANITKITTRAISIVVKFINTVANNMPRIIAAGTNLIVKFLTGLQNAIPKIAPKATNVVVAFIRAIGTHAQRITLAGVDMVIKLVNGVANGIRAREGEMNAAGRNLASAVISGMVSGISGGISAVTTAARNLASSALSSAKNFLGINSPSKEFMKVGAGTAEGMVLGMNNNAHTVGAAAEDMGKTALDTIQHAMSGINDAVPGVVDLSPTIRPVLDLSQLQNEASKIGSALEPGAIRPTVSLGKARAILEDEVGTRNDPPPPAEGPSVTNYTQNINAPVAPSPVQVHRNTKNLLTLKKGALGIE